MAKRKGCGTGCPCLCHDAGHTMQHGEHPRCPTKDGLPLLDPMFERSAT